MARRPGDQGRIFSEAFNIASGTSALTCGYSLEDCDHITFVVGLSTLSAAAASAPALTVVQSADVGLSTNAAVASCTGSIGIATANQVSRARQVLVTLGATNFTTGAHLVINGESLEFSSVTTTITDNDTVYGASVNSASGASAISANLTSKINNSTRATLRNISALNPTTNTVRIILDDDNATSTGMSVVSTAATGLALTMEKQQSMIEVKADDLNSTSQYVGLGIGTAVTAMDVSVAVVKSGMRYLKTQHGQRVTSPAT